MQGSAWLCEQEGLERSSLFINRFNTLVRDKALRQRMSRSAMRLSKKWSVERIINHCMLAADKEGA